MPPASKPRARPTRPIRPPRPHARRPAPARASHTAKRPIRCPRCGSVKLVRKGTRTKKLETVQLWKCRACGRVFTPAPPALSHKTYPIAVILDGVTLYNLGHTLAEAAAKLKSRHGLTIAPSTLAGWIDEHRDLATYAWLRDAGRRMAPPAQTIRTVKLYHRQVYEYAYHRPKLALLTQGAEHARFTGGLASFLEAAPKTCPHDLFTASVRASQTAADFIDRKRLTALGKENFATRTAALVIPAVGNNYLRHEKLQRFMLANDSVTVAVEVPIWLTRPDITALERHHGIRLLPDDAPADQTITGHIDFLQVRNGAVHILDYRPDARTNRPFAQLTIYALALTRLAGLRLFDIKCAWFNEEQYCEFFPRTSNRHGNLAPPWHVGETHVRPATSRRRGRPHSQAPGPSLDAGHRLHGRSLLSYSQSLSLSVAEHGASRLGGSADTWGGRLDNADIESGNGRS
jgi:transcription elongation factor Elf1